MKQLWGGYAALWCSTSSSLEGCCLFFCGVIMCWHVLGLCFHHSVYFVNISAGGNRVSRLGLEFTFFQILFIFNLGAVHLHCLYFLYLLHLLLRYGRCLSLWCFIFGRASTWVLRRPLLEIIGATEHLVAFTAVYRLSDSAYTPSLCDAV